MSILASVSIGPSVLLAASNGVNFGRKRALAGVFGHVCAVLLLAIVSASGLGIILLTSESAFSIIKYLGAAYLIYIGLMIWTSKGKYSFITAHQKTPAKRQLFKQSFLLGISNPKALVFFTSLFPQFIDPDFPVVSQFLILAGTSLTNAFIFTSVYVIVAFRFRQQFLASANKAWINKATGGLFVSFAGMLIVS